MEESVMEEALMDHSMLRRLVLEQQLREYVSQHRAAGEKASYFECGPEFGVARIVRTTYRWPLLEWITVEECPVDLDDLPKEDS